MSQPAPVPSPGDATPAPVGDRPVPAAAGGRRDVPPATPRSVTLGVSMLVAAVLAGVLAVLPAPYVVDSPGPTKDVLGTVGSTPLISVSGAATYPTTGQLRLTTVSAVGTPGYPAQAVQVLAGWFSRWSVVSPVEQQVQSGVTRQQLEQETNAQMISSQEEATVAALTELGYEVPATLTVAGTVPGSGAVGVLDKDDVLVAIDHTALPDYATLVRTLRAATAGSTVTVTVTRGGRQLDLAVKTGARDGGGAALGVYVDPTFHPPIDVKITIDGIGGPSAGTMFALGIIDKLTPQDEAHGAVVAGTGTIDVLGDVGAIGGIRQKLAAAHRDGAAWFLAPTANCDEVVGHVPAGLHVVAISTLHQARQDLIAIGQGKGAGLAGCSSS